MSSKENSKEINKIVNEGLINIFNQIPVQPDNVYNSLEIGFLDEIFNTQVETQKLLTVPVTLHSLLHPIYNARFVHMRIALILWCKVNIIRNSTKNSEPEIKSIINYTLNNIIHFKKNDEFPIKTNKSFTEKITQIVNKIITNSISQIRNAHKSEQFENLFKKTVESYKRESFNIESNELDALGDMFFQSCKVNTKYSNELKGNNSLYQKANKIVRQYLLRMIHAEVNIQESIELKENQRIESEESDIDI